jgi:DNA-binding transcriptional MerR regulator/methylmalonyl-CoA mutase cobalamin-binding subunit
VALPRRNFYGELSYTATVPDSTPAGGAPAEPDRLSIGAVVAAVGDELPDVTPSSLRFLERQGLLVPRRSPGGHRLYTPADVARLRRIKRWQREHLPLAEIRERLAALDRLPAPGRLAEAFLDQGLAGRGAEARRTLVQAHDAGLPLVRLFEEVLRPALEELGERWAAGRLSVGQEHEVSALARDVVAELTAGLPEPPLPLGVAVAACPPGERHDLGLRMAAAVWAARGYRVHFLGADLPAESILEAVLRRGAGVLLLSAATEATYAALEAAVRAVATLPAGARPGVVAGGQAVRGHQDALRALGAEPWLGLDGDQPAGPPAAPSPAA